jgi:superfamily II RNA helicase
VTNDELIKHRLHELEEFAVGQRQTERDVDTIKLALTDFDRRLTQIQTAMEKNDDRISASLSRLHERLDEAMTDHARDEAREEGRQQAHTSTWKVVAYTITTMIAFGLLIVAALNFALN